MPAGQNRFERRRFLGMGLAATSAGALASCARVNGPPWRFFTPAEAATVNSICEQIIPSDCDPGAAQALAVRYIDLQLTRHLKRHRRTYREGIAAVDGASRARFGKRFVQLNFAGQTAVLNGIERTSRPFFELILAHTMQGFYGDPRHGGNREAVSWKMLGLAFPPVRGRVRGESKG